MGIIHNKISVEKNTKIELPLASVFWRLITDGVNPKRIEDPAVCATCNTITTELVTESKTYGKIRVTPHECNADRKKAHVAHAEEERIAAFSRGLGKCGGYQNRLSYFQGIEVSPSDIGDRGEHQTPLLDMAYRIADDRASEIPSMFIDGPTGTGKTFICRLINNELVRNFNHSTFIKAVDLALLMRRVGYDKTMQNVLNELKQVDTLIVDDFGTQKNTDYVKESIFSIFDTRYDNKKRTIITTNLHLSEITDDDPRLGSRFADTKWMKHFQLIGNDVRKSRPLFSTN